MRGYYVRNIGGLVWEVLNAKGEAVSKHETQRQAEAECYRLNFQKQPPAPVSYADWRGSTEVSGE